MTSTSLRLAICGGGPGGLALARYLQSHLSSTSASLIEIKVYERDLSRDARTQGGSLDLHEGTGQKAMSECGLEKEWRKFARSEGEQMLFLDCTGKVLYDTGPEDNNRPEIDRTDLRDILIDSLSPETIVWDHSLRSASPTSSGTYLLNFSSSSSPNPIEIECDILVGADGTFSKVRPLLTPQKPIYSGITYIEITLGDSVSKSKEVADWTGDGSSFVLSEKGDPVVMLQRSSKRTRIYVAVVCEEDYLEKDLKIQLNDTKLAAPVLLELFKNRGEGGWSEEILGLFKPEKSEGAPWRRWPIYGLPPSINWRDSKLELVTVIGDAAHIMPPSGEGVNLSLLDAVELGESLVRTLPEGKHAINAGIKAFEEVMLARSEGEAKDSADMLHILYFAEDAPIAFLHWFRDMMDAHNAASA